MRGLQRADHRLFVTVCRRHLGGIAGSGRARGRPRGRTVPGRACGHRGDGVPAATLGYVYGTLPGAAWHGGPDTPARPVLSVRFPVLSVQLLRSVHGGVVMVRRRSTVRFRNGAPQELPARPGQKLTGQLSSYAMDGSCCRIGRNLGDCVRPGPPGPLGPPV